ncbi:MAG TPA: HIT family protein [Pseudonocardiaceae bacterium]|nr:HIT family protein [Pseudonocardiaceae bacterium]
MPDDCVFCAIARQELSSERVYEDERTIAFLDINPATTGHTLVIPRSHCQDLLDADPADLSAIARTAQLVAKAAQLSLGAHGVNLVQASGEVAFQTVFHLHFHVIPRYQIDELIRPWTPVPGNPTAIRDAAAVLRAGLPIARTEHLI